MLPGVLVLALLSQIHAIRVWQPYGPVLGTGPNPIYTAALDFRAQTGTEVLVEQASSLESLNALVAQNASHLPDIALVGNTDIGLLMKRGILHPLNAFYSAWRKEREDGDIKIDFSANQAYSYSFNGTWWALPFDVGTRALFYRRDLYRIVLGSDEAPNTFATLIANAKALQDVLRHQGVWGLALPYGADVDVVHLFHSFLQGYGGSLYAGDGTCGFRSQESLDAVNVFQSIATEHHVSPMNVSSDDVFALLRDGKAAHVFGFTSWNDALINPNSAFAASVTDRDNNVGMIRVPAGPYGRYGFLGGDAWVISATAADIPACERFLKLAFEPNGHYLRTLFPLTTAIPAYDSLKPIGLAFRISLPYRCQQRLMQPSTLSSHTPSLWKYMTSSVWA